MSKQFSISTPDTSELNSNKELYRWYHDYLPPMATLFNAKLGDQSGDAVSFSTDFEPLPETYEEALLSPAQLSVMNDMMNAAGEGDDADLTEALANHPAFSEESVSFGLFGDGYDKQTGVPSAEKPELISYLIPRGLFQKFNEGVTKGLNKNPPRLERPEDYQAIFDTYFNDAQKHTRVAGKVMAFAGQANLYASDEMFGWQRVAGTNPRVLMGLSTARLDALLGKMALTDAHLQEVAGAGATLQAEAAAGRLYYCDYSLLDGLPTQQGRFMTPAIGVFWSDIRAGQLRPVAIQLQQTHGRIHTPSQPGWPSARVTFQVADFNYHEMGTHLSEAHFGQEAFPVAARRNLSSNHPIGALMQQIYWGLLFNNALGRMQLVNPGGYTDKMMAGVLETGSLEIVKQYFAKVWRWDDWDLERYIERQGTGDTTGLPFYPYRDDGLPVWKAIQAFATNFVAAWYVDDRSVALDEQLEAFVQELGDPEKGNLRVKGFPERVLTRADLSSVIARLVWQASAGHGGINYSQYQYFAETANAPGSGYADCNLPDGTPLPSLMQVLPPVDKAITQGDIFNVLTQKVFGRLGTYDSDFIDRLNPAAKDAVTSFQTALRGVAATIDQHNSSDVRRGRNYVWLNPNNLPNSTNI